MQTRLIMGIVLALCAVIFVIQNMHTATFKILFISIQMPALVFYAILLVIGFALGILIKNKK